jgi:chromosome segregation ATPase
VVADTDIAAGNLRREMEEALVEYQEKLGGLKDKLEQAAGQLEYVREEGDKCQGRARQVKADYLVLVDMLRQLLVNQEVELVRRQEAGGAGPGSGPDTAAISLEPDTAEYIHAKMGRISDLIASRIRALNTYMADNEEMESLKLGPALGAPPTGAGASGDRGP